MRITFFSNYLGYHQISFCLEMLKIKDVDFKFVAFETIPKVRRDMGFEDLNNKYGFVVRAYENQEEIEKAKILVEDSDVAIIGMAESSLFDKRIEQNKLTFKYSERLFKSGIYRRFFPTTFKKVYDMFLKYKSKQFKILCASAYTPYDLNLCGMKDNTYQWGYFPEVDELDIADIISKKNQKQVQILWVGRMVDLKHPEKAILIAEKLKKDKIDFHLRMIGDGPLLTKMKAMIERKGLIDQVELLRNKSQHEVRSFMKEANIYLFTSDRKEGWGSVLTESMNYGCGVIASHTAGSTPFIAEHKKTALIYDSDSIDSLYENVKLLSCDLEFCRNIGLAAYDSLINNFSPRIVANRFYKLCTNLLDGNEDVFVDKVCSKAQSISENEMYRKLIGR